MSHRLRLRGAIGASLAILLAISSTVFALFPINGRFAYALPPTPPAGNSSQTTSSSNGSSTSVATATVPEQLTTIQLEECQKRSSAILTIMDRADIRVKNQLTLFTKIATNVEAFYVAKDKPLPTYSQLVATINNTEVQADADLATLQNNSDFTCLGNNPVGIVSTYRNDLQTMQNDLQSLRMAVKNLILGVAQAIGYTLPSGSTRNEGQ